MLAPLTRKNSYIKWAICLPRRKRSCFWAFCSSRLTLLQKWELRMILPGGLLVGFCVFWGEERRGREGSLFFFEFFPGRRRRRVVGEGGEGWLGVGLGRGLGRSWGRSFGEVSRVFRRFFWEVFRRVFRRVFRGCFWGVRTFDTDSFISMKVMHVETFTGALQFICKRAWCSEPLQVRSWSNARRREADHPQNSRITDLLLCFIKVAHTIARLPRICIVFWLRSSCSSSRSH